MLVCRNVTCGDFFSSLFQFLEKQLSQSSPSWILNVSNKVFSRSSSLKGDSTEYIIYGKYKLALTRGNFQWIFGGKRQLIAEVPLNFSKNVEEMLRKKVGKCVFIPQ